MPYAEDEPPTRPDGMVDLGARMITRLYAQCAPLDRRRLARLVERWYTCNLDDRILLEMLADRLAKPRP